MIHDSVMLPFGHDMLALIDDGSQYQGLQVLHILAQPGNVKSALFKCFML
jgi:hypothetical protein